MAEANGQLAQAILAQEHSDPRIIARHWTREPLFFQTSFRWRRGVGPMVRARRVVQLLLAPWLLSGPLTQFARNVPGGPFTVQWLGTSANADGDGLITTCPVLSEPEKYVGNQVLGTTRLVPKVRQPSSNQPRNQSQTVQLWSNHFFQKS